MKQQEIDSAAYINDPLVHAFKEELENNRPLLNKCQSMLMPKRKQSLNDRDKINYILSRTRTVLSMRYIPIQSYAAASSKSDVIRNYMLLKVEKDSVADTLSLFVKIMDKLFAIRNVLVSMGSFIADNNLFFEVMYWGLSIVLDLSPEKFDSLDDNKIALDMVQCSDIPAIWNNISVEKNDFNMVFFATGSHYYKSILNRYTFVANYLSNETQIDFSSKIKNKIAFDQIMSQTPTVEHFRDFKLSKNGSCFCDSV